MKRTTLTLLSLCLALALAAEPVGREAALFTAKAYLTAKGKSINATQSPVSSPRKAASASASDDAYYYVFNAGNDGGYVIVSGDDRTEPILGYVEQGNFDPENIPENMRSWLQGYADQIKYIVDNNLDPSSPLLKKRNKVRGTKHSVPELLTTRWNQGQPYNITCPKYYKGDGSQDYPATGCTATAMAQVMNFYKYPEKTKTVIPALTNSYTLDDGTTKTSTAKAVPRGTPIDWENMRDTYSWNVEANANAQDTAVANLMLYCGQSVNMGWGASSGANFSAEAYTKYFGFDDQAHWVNRSDYDIDDWTDMLYEELEGGDIRNVMHFNPAIAPVKIGILPLSKKLGEGAENIYEELSKYYNCEFDDRGAIGKRYRRQDEIGTPYCVTFDFDSETDKSVTIRDRDSMEQERVAIAELKDYFRDKFEFI
mgnify:CR=1 FL=1